VLIDNVFYPLLKKEIKRSPVFKPSSSGVAAHFDEDEAIKNAVLELLERDAFCVFWYSGKKMKLFPKNILPLNIQQNISFYRKFERNVYFYNLSIDSVPIVLCVILGNSYPYLVTGAKASFSFDDAVEKSFEEAEASLLAWSSDKKKKISVDEVKSPREHGQFYATQKNNKEIRFMLSKQKIDDDELEFIKKNNFTIFDIAKKFKILKVCIHKPQERGDIWVYRALSTELIPMGFGFGGECYKHKRMDRLGLKWKKKYPSMPHFFPYFFFSIKWKLL